MSSVCNSHVRGLSNEAGPHTQTWVGKAGPLLAEILQESCKGSRPMLNAHHYVHHHCVTDKNIDVGTCICMRSRSWHQDIPENFKQITLIILIVLLVHLVHLVQVGG